MPGKVVKVRRGGGEGAPSLKGERVGGGAGRRVALHPPHPPTRPSTVLSWQVFVEMGQRVAEGEALVAVEAMKMEHTGEGRCACVRVNVCVPPGLDCPYPALGAPPLPTRAPTTPTHAVVAPCAGVVAELPSYPDQQVDEGRVLAVVAPEQAAAAAGT